MPQIFSPSSRPTCNIVLCCVIALVTVSLPDAAFGKLRSKTAQKQDVTITFVAEYLKLARTTIGPNDTFYIGLLGTKKHPATSIAKISYRYLDFETEIPPDFVTLESAHRFMALRDERCDQNLGAIRKQLTLTGSSIWRTVISDSDIDAQIVKCWVITPDDYRGTRRVTGSVQNSQFGY